MCIRSKPWCKWLTVLIYTSWNKTMRKYIHILIGKQNRYLYKLDQSFIDIQPGIKRVTYSKPIIWTIYLSIILKILSICLYLFILPENKIKRKTFHILIGKQNLYLYKLDQWFIDTQPGIKWVKNSQPIILTIYLSIILSIILSIYRFIIYISINLSIYISIYLSIFLSF